MPRIKLTKSAINSLPSLESDVVYWDTASPAAGAERMILLSWTTPVQQENPMRWRTLIGNKNCEMSRIKSPSLPRGRRVCVRLASERSAPWALILKGVSTGMDNWSRIRNRIKLTYWQSVGAIVVSFFVIIGGLGSAAQGTAVFHDCKMQLWSFACPRSAPANPVNIEPKSGARN